MAISAKEVKQLRDATSCGMMDCKRALQETDGDFDKAMRLLRERGEAVATKRKDRAAKEGQVAAWISDDGKTGSMIEVNCETDFVARNDDFQAFVADLLVDAQGMETGKLAEASTDKLNDKIAAIGENLLIRRNVTISAETGSVTSYIHMGGKVGVLVSVACDKAETVESPVYKELCKDITLQIAAASPQFLVRGDVDEELVASESAIFAKQVEGKPENIIGKIVTGKLDKFYSQICLVEQGFVKEPSISITELVNSKAKELDDTITIKSYVRYQLGE